MQQDTMSDFFRKYWFVCVLAVVFIGVLIYFVADLNKDNVTTMKADGQDVVASTSLGNVTSSELLDNSVSSEPAVLFSAYRNMVTDQSIETTSEIEESAKRMARNLESNMKADASGKTEYSILSQLAAMGFTGDNALKDYCKIAAKVETLDGEFVKEHLDQLTSYIPEGARTVSILTMNVDNAETLSEDAKKKQEDIQKAFDEGKSFADIAKEFSEDENTKEKGGEFGYIDSTSTTLDTAVITAAKDLKEGETSDWITVQPSGMQTYTLYKVHVDKTDPKKILEEGSDEAKDTLVTTIISKASGLEALVIKNAGSKLDVKFANDTVKKQVESYMAQQISYLDPQLQALEAISSDDSAKESKTSSSSQAASESSASASSAASAQSSTESKEGE